MATRISAVTVPKLEDQAANAALYAPKTDSKDGNRFLDSDNKLSSASKCTITPCATQRSHANSIIVKAPPRL
jgi:hypothetical protein